MATNGARLTRGIVITVVIVLVLLVAADRVGDYIAERSAADTIKSSQNLSSKPDVDIDGFPFLTQLAGGKFDKITITAKDVPVGESAHLLDISRVRVVLHTITVSRDFSSVHADTAAATATVTFAELGKTLGIDVGYAGDGRIRATKDVTLAGTTLHASLTTQPRIVNGALSFAGTAIDNAGQLSGAVTSALNRVFDLSVPLQGIPFKIQVRSLRVDRGGVQIDLTGSDLSYSS